MQDNSTIQIKVSEDGSHTLYLGQIDETYHSIHGAINESMYIFIKSGLAACKKKNVKLLEIGFGTGLNAYLSLIASKKKEHIYYTSVEKYPLSEQIWKTLNYAKSSDIDIFQKLHLAKWNESIQILNTFTLCKLQEDFTLLSLKEQYDVIFFDAFSPEKQPEMWTEEIFKRLYESTAEGGVLTTYCAKGIVRRAMLKAGYKVERIPGPKGKREILRAIK